MLCFSTVVNSQSLSEISRFAKDICDELDVKGNMTRTKIVAGLKGNAKTISKLLGGSIGADGKITVDNIEYEGIPYDQLSAQMSNARQCKIEIAHLLLEKNTQIKGSRGSHSLKPTYAINRSGYDIFLMKQPKYSAFIDINNNPYKDHRLIDGTKIALIDSEYIERSKETANLNISWRKVKITSGEYVGKVGWVPASNITFK